MDPDAGITRSGFPDRAAEAATEAEADFSTRAVAEAADTPGISPETRTSDSAATQVSPDTEAAPATEPFASMILSSRAETPETAPDPPERG